jgi:outer membrane receptor protein involved in Fe transport
MSVLLTFRPFDHYRALALALALGAHAAAACGAAAPSDLTVLPLEQLLSMEVYSASKFVQKSSQAPALVTVISAADIRRYGWRTLADVARSVRGLYVSYDRNYSYLGERGFLRPGDYNTRFLLLVDGNRVNDGVYDQAPLGGEFPLELDLVERIEFVPGPGSSIHGSNAFFGVINVVSKKAADLPGTRVGLEAGGAGARKVTASTSWRAPRGADMLLAASAHRSDGRDLYYREFDTPEQNHGVAEGRDYERGERLLASATDGPFSLTLMHARRLKGVPTASFFQPFNDPRSNTLDRQSYLNAAVHAPAGAAALVHARLFWGAYDSIGAYVNDDASRSLNRDGSKARWWGAELSLQSSGQAGHTILAGLDYQRDYRLHQFIIDSAPLRGGLDDRRAGSRAGFYLQDELALSERTLLNLGLRYDRNTGMAGVASPRVALIHRLGPDSTVKLIHGSAFRAPNAFERYYAFPGPGGQLPNPSLAPERIRSSELALVRQLGQRARLTATVFGSVVHAIISQVPVADVPETRFENGAPVRSRGLELEYEQRWLSGAALRASASLARVGDGQQVNAPARMVKVNLTAPLGAGAWRGAVEAHYVGARGTPSKVAPAFWLLNANLVRARLWRNGEASLGLYNLLGKHYADPASVEHRQSTIAQDGRTLRARISHAF